MFFYQMNGRCIYFVVLLCILFVKGVIPEFLGTPDDTQYGVEGRTSEVVLRLRAYPEPKVTWNFHNTWYYRTLVLQSLIILILKAFVCDVAEETHSVNTSMM